MFLTRRVDVASSKLHKIFHVNEYTNELKLLERRATKNLKAVQETHPRYLYHAYIKLAMLKRCRFGQFEQASSKKLICTPQKIFKNFKCKWIRYSFYNFRFFIHWNENQIDMIFPPFLNFRLLNFRRF